MTSKFKIIVVIPAFDEADSIEGVIADLRAHGYKDLVVVDDGSSDQTSSKVKKNKVPVLRHVTNRGLGAALGTGFAYAKQFNFDIFVTFDADGQHAASDIKRLIAPLVANKADIVIGSRLLGSSQEMPFERKVMNHLSNILTYLLYGVWTTDSQSGLRAFSKKAVDCITIKTDRMEVSSEFFKEIKRNKLRFAEVPISTIYTEYSQAGSHQEKWASFKMPMRLFLRLFR